MEITDYAFFPTRVITIQFPETESLNAQLCELLDQRPELDDKFNTQPEAMNLLRLASTVPAIAQLRTMFMTAATRWLEAEGIRGVTGMDLLLFTNRMAPGDSTTVHNHRADLVGIYYARTASATHNPIQTTDGADYFDAGDGVLLLHDPRFNANLTAVCERDHVKVFPRPGLMLVFPAYLWHSVTPHRGNFHRVAWSMNFTLRWPAGPEEFQPLQ